MIHLFSLTDIYIVNCRDKLSYKSVIIGQNEMSDECATHANTCTKVVILPNCTDSKITNNINSSS